MSSATSEQGRGYGFTFKTAEIMKRKDTINNQHPDLARASDDLLAKELEYIHKAYLRSAALLSDALKMLYLNERPPLPLWMCQDDVNYHIDRYTAVCEEIQYRKDSMR